MQWRNSEVKFGVITRCLHALIALLIIGQLFLGLFMSYVHLPIFYFIHKSLGVTLLFLAVIFVLWLCIDRHAPYPNTMPNWEKLIAVLVRYLLIIGIVVMPVSGWLMSCAAGYPPSFWGWFTLSAPIPQSKIWLEIMDQTHLISAWILSGLIVLHILAAIKHAVVDKDVVLKRMF